MHPRLAACTRATAAGAGGFSRGCPLTSPKEKESEKNKKHRQASGNDPLALRLPRFPRLACASVAGEMLLAIPLLGGLLLLLFY